MRAGGGRGGHGVLYHSVRGLAAKRGFGATCPKSTFSGHVPEQGIDLPFLRTVSAGMQRVPRVPLGMRISLSLLKVPVRSVTSLCRTQFRTPAYPVSGGNDSTLSTMRTTLAFLRARTMHHAFRNNESLSWCKFDRAVGQVDQQLSLYHVEKFVVVLVPVILALHHAQANHRFVLLEKSLVVSLVGAGIGERPLIDHFASLACSAAFRMDACRLAHKSMCHIVIRFARP